MRLPPAGHVAPPELRRARRRLALHYALAICAVAVAVVGVIFVLLSRSIDVEATESRTVLEQTDAGGVEAQEEVVTEVREAEERIADQTLAQLRDASLLVLGGLVAASPVAGWLIAGRALAPVEAAMAARRRFVGDASHELRNPLAVMRTSLDLALEEPRTSQAEWREVGQGMRDTVDRMTAVVDSLLQTAREDVPALQRGALEPAALLRSLANQVEALAATKDVTVVVEAEPARLASDPAAIERALANLVDNAMRYAPVGSTVTLSGQAVGPDYELRVRDTGAGLPAEEVEAVFERGHRSPDSPGLGLGLAIARDIVQAHGGRLVVEHTGPGGTSFLMRLPRVPARDDSGER